MEPEEPFPFTEYEVALIAKTVYGEADVCSNTEQELVVWCICNRVDSGLWGSSIELVVTASQQFHGYSPDNPVTEEHVDLVTEVLCQWYAGEQPRVHAPYATSSSYLYFAGDGFHNWFREEYHHDG